MQTEGKRGNEGREETRMGEEGEKRRGCGRKGGRQQGFNGGPDETKDETPASQEYQEPLLYAQVRMPG
eukprot:14362-Hanusia_phi.AAC.2